jgi:Plasmid pRiA4b ORF-3-like protein
LIWWRLLVPGQTTIAQLHTILQTAFGWDGEHLHRFRSAEPGRVYPHCTGGRRPGPPEGWGGPWEFLERTQPYLVFEAMLRAAEIVGQLLDADEDDELASLLPLLGLEQFDRRACNKALVATSAAASATERSQ